MSPKDKLTIEVSIRAIDKVLGFRGEIEDVVNELLEEKGENL